MKRILLYRTYGVWLLLILTAIPVIHSFDHTIGMLAVHTPPAEEAVQPLENQRIQGMPAIEIETINHEDTKKIDNNFSGQKRSFLINTEPLKIVKEKEKGQLDILVENATNKIIYVCGFAYSRRKIFSQWRWYKSPVYEIPQNQTVTVDIVTAPDPSDRADTFGYLGVFDTYQEAEDAVFELLADEKKIDLDLLSFLKNKKVRIEIESYGFKQDFFDWDFIDLKKKTKKIPELDFYVLNNTGQAIYLCCFVYERKSKGHWIAATEEKDDMTQWRYDKTKVLYVKPGELAYIDIDTIHTNRDRNNIIGTLAIFNEDEKKEAEEATYELLESEKMLHLGPLKRLKNKKIVIDIARYGLKGVHIDFVPKKMRKIDFTRDVKHHA